MTATTEVSVTDRSREQIELIKDTIAREQQLTDPELRLFLYTAERLGLDPLAKQIYAIRRGGKLTFQTGIDGFRLVAARTKEYAGSDEPSFEQDAAGLPIKATVTVHRFVQGQRCPFTATARWSEYYPGEGNIGMMWRNKPFTMLAKCAEALALRKAFPAELSGLYSDDEMEQAGRSNARPPKALRAAPAEPGTFKAELKRVQRLALSRGMTKDDWDGLVAQLDMTAVETLADLARIEAALPAAPAAAGA